ncbi:uncharacterized protein BYT42DRAFT_554406, partial [Radiomyces spectabilis]|uniref:uncharacterized protein n=1 Tax=Radiomyces spectabilis TaxID=64574 RepID=UPI00221E8FB3
MLNPHASEFKPPAPSSASSSRPANPAPNSLKDKKHQNKKSQRKDATGIPKPVKSGKKGKGKSAQDTVASDASSSKQKPRDAHSNRKRKSAKAPSKEVQASSSQPDLMEPVKFLAIEEPIDPVMIVDGEETEVVHGYERYIDCVSRKFPRYGNDMEKRNSCQEIIYRYNVHWRPL